MNINPITGEPTQAEPYFILESFKRVELKAEFDKRNIVYDPDALTRDLVSLLYKTIMEV